MSQLEQRLSRLEAASSWSQPVIVWIDPDEPLLEVCWSDTGTRHSPIIFVTWDNVMVDERN